MKLKLQASSQLQEKKQGYWFLLEVLPEWVMKFQINVHPINVEISVSRVDSQRFAQSLRNKHQYSTSRYIFVIYSTKSFLETQEWSRVGWTLEDFSQAAAIYYTAPFGSPQFLSSFLGLQPLWSVIYGDSKRGTINFQLFPMSLATHKNTHFNL